MIVTQIPQILMHIQDENEKAVDRDYKRITVKSEIGKVFSSYCIIFL